jgi:hypothetical protein
MLIFQQASRSFQVKKPAVLLPQVIVEGKKFINKYKIYSLRYLIYIYILFLRARNQDQGLHRT